MKKVVSSILTASMLSMAIGSLAFAGEGQPPAAPSGSEEQMAPGGESQGAPGGESQGAPGGSPGGPGGMQSAPSEYDAVYTQTEDAVITGTVESTGTDENAIWISSGTTTIQDAEITRISEDSTGGDAGSFYGVGAAILATEGTAVIENSTITTDAAGGTGVFAYGDGVVYISDTVINTTQRTSGGIHVAGGGTLYARNLTVTTQGGSSAAIRSDRGSGTMVVDGGSYTSNGEGSPAVYVTADITIHDAILTANGSEALCLEGLNRIRLYESTLTGSMLDLEQNDNTWTVILYQSMSGDSQVGEGYFEMVDGSLISTNGGLFYTTNTESEFILQNVEITTAEDSEYFLRVTGNANQRVWGKSGANGADCKFTAISQEMNGDVIWDSISTLNLYAVDGSSLTGAFINDETAAGEGGDGYASLYIDESSSWTVTGDSVLTNLYCAGTIQDEEGNSVTIQTEDGTVLAEGDSSYVITLSTYEDSCDVSEAGTAASWEAYKVEF